MLRPEKYWWCKIDFEWKESNWYHKSHDDDNLVLEVRDHEGINTPIKRIEPNTSELTLGFRIAADGNTEGEKLYLTTKSKEWAKMMKKAFL